MVSERKIRTSLEEEHEKLGKWCWGRLDAMHWLQLVALASLLSDLVCTFLMLGDFLAGYYFVCSSMVSLLCVGAVVSGVQEERRWLVQLSSVVSALKGLLLATLFTVTTVGVMGGDVNTSRGVDYVVPEGKSKLLLLVCLPLLIALALLQWRLSYRVSKWIDIRDELYIIPAYHHEAVKEESGEFDYQRMWRCKQEVPASSSREKF